MLRHSACATLLIAGIAALVAPASAQSLPSLSTLTGSYSVRYLGVNSSGSSDVALSFSGTFTFDGKGGFTVTGQGTTGSGPLQIATSGRVQLACCSRLKLSSSGKRTYFSVSCPL